MFWYATMIMVMIMPSNIKNRGCFDMQLCCCDLISHNMVHSPLYSALFVFLVPASLSPNKVQNLTRGNVHIYQVGLACTCIAELLNKCKERVCQLLWKSQNQMQYMQYSGSHIPQHLYRNINTDILWCILLFLMIRYDRFWCPCPHIIVQLFIHAEYLCFLETYLCGHILKESLLATLTKQYILYIYYI